MTAGFDLQVDTDGIRQAAATLADVARRFGGAAPGAGPVVGADALGDDREAVAQLITTRCCQAQQAAEQLAAVATGMSEQLAQSAETFDRMERGIRWPR